mgnify:CR=1 FL=1
MRRTVAAEIAGVLVLVGVAIALWAFLAGSKPQGFGIEYPGQWGSVVSLAAFAVLGFLLVRTSRAGATVAD